MEVDPCLCVCVVVGQVLWVDNLDASEGVLLEFKQWLEDPSE